MPYGTTMYSPQQIKDMNNYNGQTQNVRRRYDSLQNFVGKNEVYNRGDILCVSTRNNDVYDLLLDADGVSTFITLYNRWKNGESASGTVPVAPNADGHVNTFDEIVALLQGLPEGSNLKEIIDAIDKSGLTDEEREQLERIANAEEVSEEDLEEGWEQVMQDALNGGEEAGSDTGADDGSSDI